MPVWLSPPGGSPQGGKESKSGEKIDAIPDPFFCVSVAEAVKDIL